MESENLGFIFPTAKRPSSPWIYLNVSLFTQTACPSISQAVNLSWTVAFELGSTSLIIIWRNDLNTKRWQIILAFFGLKGKVVFVR